MKNHWSTIRPCTIQHQKKWKILLKFKKYLTNSMKLKGVDSVIELLNVLKPIVEKKLIQNPTEI